MRSGMQGKVLSFWQDCFSETWVITQYYNSLLLSPAMTANSVLHFLSQFLQHGSGKMFLGTSKEDGRGREQAGHGWFWEGGGKQRRVKFVKVIADRMREEERQTHKASAFSIDFLLLCAGVELLWEHPPSLTFLNTMVTMTTGPSVVVTTGLPWTRSIVHSRVAARMRRLLQRPPLSCTCNVPMGTASRCPVCSCHGDCIPLPVGR